MTLNKLDGPYTNISFYCISCKHLSEWSCGNAVCKAYPEGIPLEIWTSFDENICRGNNGYRYEEMPDTDDDEDVVLLEDL